MSALVKWWKLRHCRAGRHVGQDRGGLVMFICTRCGEAHFQTDPRYRQAMDRVRMAEAVGDDEMACRIYAEALPDAPPLGPLPPLPPVSRMRDV